LENYIKKAKTPADYIDLIQRIGILPEAMAYVLGQNGEKQRNFEAA